MISVLADLLILVLWPSKWSTLEKESPMCPRGEPALCCCRVKCSVDVLALLGSGQLESSVSSAACLDVLLTTEGAVLRSLTVTIELSFSLQFCQFLFRVFLGLF